jgi:hypothetical protein
VHAVVGEEHFVLLPRARRDVDARNLVLSAAEFVVSPTDGIFRLIRWLPASLPVVELVAGAVA